MASNLAAVSLVRKSKVGIDTFEKSPKLLHADSMKHVDTINGNANQE